MASSSTYPTHAELMAGYDRMIAECRAMIAESEAIRLELKSGFTDELDAMCRKILDAGKVAA